MRVVLVYSYVPTHLGGIEVVVDSLAREWARRGHDVVAVGADVGGATTRPRSSAYRTVGVRAPNWAETRFGVPYPMPTPAMIAALRREVRGADVVHGHGFLAFPTFAALAIARADGRPIRLLTEHVGHVPYASSLLEGVETAAVQTAGRATAHLAEGIVVFNQRVERELRALAPSTPQRWITNGVDGATYFPVAADERARLRAELGWDDRPRVLFVGRLVPRKGADVCVEVARLGAGTFELVMVGSGSLPSTPPHVSVRGTLPFDEVARLYRAADAFLLPSSGEGFPLTAQEALASGLPVFLGEDPSYGPYIEGAGTSVRLVPREASAIAAILREHFASPERRVQAGADALVHARRSFSWAGAVDEHVAFMDELQQRRRRR